MNADSFDLGQLRTGLYASINSKPMQLSDAAALGLYKQMRAVAQIQLKGKQLEPIRRAHLELASEPVSQK